MSLTVEKTCNYCQTNYSPIWRKGPSDRPRLCNACGVRYMRKGKLELDYVNKKTIKNKTTNNITQNNLDQHQDRSLLMEHFSQIEIIFGKLYKDYHRSFKHIKKQIKKSYIQETDHDQDQIDEIFNKTKEFAEKFHLFEGYSIQYSINKACKLANEIYENEFFNISDNSAKEYDKYSINSSEAEDQLQTLCRKLHNKIDQDSEVILFRDHKLTYWDCFEEIMQDLVKNTETDSVIIEKIKILNSLSKHLLILE